MASPNDRRYLASHEWHQDQGGTVTVGISQFAVDELTDITYLDIKKKSGPIKAGEAFGEIESVKATSELYAGVDGTITEVNQAAIQNPAIINQDPFGQGWLIKIKPSNPAQLDKLLSAEQYDKR
jgi:glycine cleavage system H protein